MNPMDVVNWVKKHYGISISVAAAVALAAALGVMQVVEGPSSSGRESYEWTASRIVLAGVDRDWLHLDPKDVCAAAAKAGVTGISLEMLGNDWGLPSNLRAKYNEYLSEARKRKLKVFVCVMNDWAPAAYQQKYGPAYLDIVLKGGPEGVIAQPVGETHTSHGSAFERTAFQRLESAGFKTCYNGQGGRPTSQPPGYEYRAWHSGGVNPSSTAPSGSIEISDHSEKIRFIGFYNAKNAGQYAASAAGRDAGVGIYGYVNMGGDNGSPKSVDIKTRAAAWKAAADVYGGGKKAPKGDAKDAKDAIDIKGATLLGPHRGTDPAKAKLSADLFSAKIEWPNVRLSVGATPWSTSSPIGENIQGRIYIFWRDGGKLYGGHFDWFRPHNGTVVKKLENAGKSYLGRDIPKGAEVWFCLVSNDGKLRTDVVSGGRW